MSERISWGSFKRLNARIVSPGAQRIIDAPLAPWLEDAYKRGWIAHCVDHMGLIVALSGERRFEEMRKLNEKLMTLTPERRAQIKEILRQRFTPTNGQDGCQSAMAAVKEITK